jgi:hypothetical protein
MLFSQSKTPYVIEDSLNILIIYTVFKYGHCILCSLFNETIILNQLHCCVFKIQRVCFLGVVL